MSKALSILEQIKATGPPPPPSLLPALISIMEKNPLVGPAWGLWLFFGEGRVEGKFSLEPSAGEIERRQKRRKMVTVEDVRREESRLREARRIVHARIKEVVEG
jgi:hypothetical protein